SLIRKGKSSGRRPGAFFISLFFSIVAQYAFVQCRPYTGRHTGFLQSVIGPGITGIKHTVSALSFIKRIRIIILGIPFDQDRMPLVQIQRLVYILYQCTILLWTYFIAKT